MRDLSLKIKNELLRLGAEIVGFGNLEELPDGGRECRSASALLYKEQEQYRAGKSIFTRI